MGVGAAVLATATLAIEALKKIPSFDQRKLKDFEEHRDLLEHAIVVEDSDLILTSMSKLGTLADTYKSLL